MKQYGGKGRRASPGSAQIADTVSKMKSVLGGKKGEEGMMKVMQSGDEDEDYTADEETPQASTIIIVKGPQTFDGQEDDAESPDKPAAKKPAPRVHTVTMAGGKQIIYKGNKKVKVEEEEVKEGEEAEAQEGDEQKGEVNEEKGTKSKQAIKQAWKAVGVESQELESGDIIINADELKSAADSFVDTSIDTEYNFDESSVSQDMTRSFTSPGERKPRVSDILASASQQKVSCMVCGKVLQNYSYLYRHVKQFHRDIEDIEQYLEEIRPMMKTPCPVCGKLISSVSNMSSHIVQCHPTTPEEYRCDICGGQYKTRISLKHHMQSQHIENRRRFPCKFCGATFTEVRSLKEHINCTHETTEVFCCEVCSKTFLTRGRLRRHMYIHGEYRLFCKFCGKGFHLKDNMNKHIELMHEKKHEGRFKCDYCNKAFSVKGNLQQHVNAVHLKTLPYRCPICDEGYRKKGVMLAHMKTHSLPVGSHEGLTESMISGEDSMEDSQDMSRMEDDTMESMVSKTEEEEEEGEEEMMEEGEEGEEEAKEEEEGVEESKEEEEALSEQPEALPEQPALALPEQQPMVAEVS